MIFFNWFFFQFILSTLGWLGIEFDKKKLICFLLVYHSLMILVASSRSCLKVFFIIFQFNVYFFQFHPSILSWLRIGLYNLFHFALFKVIPALWLGLTQVVFYVFFLINFFFNFILQYWVDWKLGLIFFLIYFLWGYEGLITQVEDLNIICFRLNIFFKISS